MTEIVRCGDADRELTSERLRGAAAEGYLTMDEVEERLTGAYAAKHAHELDALVADLPASSRGTAAGWRAVLTLAWMQLRTDAGRLPVRFRRPAVAAIAVVVVLACLLAGFEVFD